MNKYIVEISDKNATAFKIELNLSCNLIIVYPLRYSPSRNFQLFEDVRRRLGLLIFIRNAFG